jgi:hypothetical protein
MKPATAASLILLGACHGSPPPSDDSSDDGTTSEPDVPTDLGDDGKLMDCISAASALVSEFYEFDQECSIVVRVGYTSLEIEGWQAFCAPALSVEESTARQTAQDATGFGLDGALLGGPTPEDLWVFYEAPGDLGGVGAVSATNGEAVFGGSIIWDGAGDIAHPPTWRDKDPLEEDCPPWGLVQVHGYDLTDGTELTQAEFDPAVSVLEQTALPGSLWSDQGILRHTVVLLYPRSVGPFDPSTAEWILVLNGGRP